MFRITGDAVRRLKQTLEEVRSGEDECLRIVVADDGPHLLLDRERPGDETLECEENLLLVMDPGSMLFFNGRMLTVDDATSCLVLMDHV